MITLNSPWEIALDQSMTFRTPGAIADPDLCVHFHVRMKILALSKLNQER